MTTEYLAILAKRTWQAKKTLSYHELFRIWKMALFTAMRLSWEGYKNAMRVCPCVRSSGFYSGEEVDLWVRSDVNEVSPGIAFPQFNCRVTMPFGIDSVSLSIKHSGNSTDTECYRYR